MRLPSVAPAKARRPADAGRTKDTNNEQRERTTRCGWVGQTERGRRETARGHEVRNAQVQRRAARASSGHVATMRFLGCAPPRDRDIQRITRDALVRRVVPCGVKRLDGITYPPERRRAQEAAAAVTWRPKCNHVNTLHAAGATPLRGPGKGTQAHHRAGATSGCKAPSVDWGRWQGVWREAPPAYGELKAAA